MANRLNLPRVSVFDGNGDPLNGAKLYFYITETSTALDTYSDAALTTANTNPVVADSSGRFGNIFLKNQLYKVVLKTSADVEVWSADPVNSEKETPGVTEKTAGYTVVAADEGELISVDASGGAVTIALPAVADVSEGFRVTVKKSDGTSNDVTIEPDGTETIDGSASVALTGSEEGVTVVCDGTNWQTTGRGVSTLSGNSDFAALLRGHISGLTLSNNSTDGDHDIDIAAGVATAADQSALLSLTSSLTKQIDAAWAVGTNEGGLDTGTVGADTAYHVFLIRRSDTGVVDALFSTSADSPTMPTNYDQKRRIGAVITDSSSNILGFFQRGDEFWFESPQEDYDSASLSTTAVTQALSVPTGINVKAYGNVFTSNASQTVRVYIYSPDAADLAPSNSAPPGVSIAAGAGGSTNTEAGGQVEMWTDTSGQIKFVAAAASTSFRWWTLGWLDRRDKDD